MGTITPAVRTSVSLFDAGVCQAYIPAVYHLSSESSRSVLCRPALSVNSADSTLFTIWD